MWPFNQKKVEERSIDPSWGALSGLNTTSGLLVNAHTAENLSAVLACTEAIASALASLPAWVYRRTDKGRELDDFHPLMKLVQRGPNRWQSWPDWMQWTVAQVLLRGNALSEIQADGAGRLVGLKPIPWEWVSVQLLSSGRLAYDVVEMTHLYGGTGRPRRLLEGEVFHLRDRSDDGLIGRSRLSRAAAVISAGLHVQQFANAVYENGVYPSGVLMADGKIGDDALRRLREMFKEAFGGSSKAAKALVVDQGLKWQQLTSISAEDAELIASRRFTVEELCRLFQVPPPIIQDYTNNTFTNSESAGRWFAQFTVQPWARKIEAEFTRSVFSEATRATHEIELDMSAFMRGDPETRWKSHEIAVKNHILTPNEVREVEGWNPRPDGDGFSQEATGNA